jgi:hypothetical protein
MAVSERRLRMNHTSPKTHLTRLGIDWTWIQQAFNIFSLFSANLCHSSFSPQKFANYLSRVKRAVTSRRRCSLSQRSVRGGVLSLCAAESDLPHLGGQDKPNSKGIFVQCRYSVTKRFSSLKPSAPKNKPAQTKHSPLDALARG